MSTDYVRIIAYYCYNSYDLLQAGSVEKVPTIKNCISVYYGMYTYDASALPYNVPFDIDNSSFDSVKEFKYLGTTLIDQNSIQEEINSRLKSGNAC